MRDATIERRQLGRFLGYLKPYWKRVAHLAFWVTLLALLRLPVPLATKYLIDDILPSGNLRTLNLLGLVLLGYYLVNQVVHVVKGFLLVGLKEKVTYRLQLDVLHRLLGLSTAYHQRHQSGYLTSRLVSDTRKVEGLISQGAFELLLDILTFLFGLGVMAFFHLKLTLLCVALLPFYLVSVVVFGRRLKESSIGVQESMSRVMGSLQQSLSGIPVVKAFGRERREMIKFSRLARRSASAIRLHRACSSSRPGPPPSSARLGPLLVLWYGGSQVMKGNLSLRVRWFCLPELPRLPLRSRENAGRLRRAAKMKEALGALGRVLEFVDAPSAVEDAADAVP